MADKIWNPERECMKRGELEALQLERLKALVDYCDRNVEFYHNRLAQAGVTADRIKTLSDVQYIPYTTKTDLRDTYPFGMFSVPKKSWCGFTPPPAPRAIPRWWATPGRTWTTGRSRWPGW